MNDMPWRMSRSSSTATRYFGLSATQVVSAPASYSPSYGDYVDLFYSLFRKWKSETYFTSAIDQILDHPAYKAIVAMGPIVVPIILSEIRRGDESLIFFALEDITGEIPYSAQEQGNMKAIREAWVSWGERTKY